MSHTTRQRGNHEGARNERRRHQRHQEHRPVRRRDPLPEVLHRSPRGEHRGTRHVLHDGGLRQPRRLRDPGRPAPRGHGDGGRRSPHLRRDPKAHPGATSHRRLHTRPPRPRLWAPPLARGGRATPGNRPRERGSSLPHLHEDGSDEHPHQPRAVRDRARHHLAREGAGLLLAGHDLPRSADPPIGRRALRASSRQGRDRRRHLGLGSRTRNRLLRRPVGGNPAQLWKPAEGPALSRGVGRRARGHRVPGGRAPPARSRWTRFARVA